MVCGNHRLGMRPIRLGVFRHEGGCIVEQQTTEISLGSLWLSNEVSAWQDALAKYWNHGPVRANIDVERHMDRLTAEERTAILSSGGALVEFLDRWYYSWKFFAIAPYDIPKHQAKVRAEYAANPAKYDAIARQLGALNPDNVEQCLKAVASRSIPGLQLSAASGLLAVLFPASFGTVDQHTLRALQTLDDDRAVWLRRHIPDPKTFFPANNNDQGRHAAKLMTQLYREKARELAQLDEETGWGPRRVEMVCYTVRPRARGRHLP